MFAHFYYGIVDVCVGTGPEESVGTGTGEEEIPGEIGHANVMYPTKDRRT